MKFNPGALRHFDHGCQSCGNLGLAFQVLHCELCNQAWNWMRSQKGLKPIELNRNLNKEESNKIDLWAKN